MTKVIAILFFLTMYATTSISQVPTSNCREAEDFFASYNGNCKSKISAHNCVHLDVTDSYDFQGKEFLFRWQMGDGTYLEGMEINHCYNRPGYYVAVLSLLDPMTKVVIEEEAKVEIVIKGEFSLEMNVTETPEIDLPVTFDYQMTYPEESYRVDAIYWYFGDGTFSCENKPEHAYTSPGNFSTNLLVRLSSDRDAEILCTSDTLKAKMTDPSQGLLKELFNNTKIESRFLADQVHYKILAMQGDDFIEILKQDSFMGGVTYKLLVYRGDLIYESPEITTESGSSNNQVLDSINSHAKLIAQTQPQQFGSIFFELDQDDLSKKNKKTIKKNIELLKQFPMLKLAIGVYTNSKGSLEKGIRLSLQRSALIKDYMVKNDVDANRIEIRNPNDSRSLINTCTTGTACDYVDPKLDRRADFKILTNLKN